MKDSDLKLSEIRRRNDETLQPRLEAIRAGADTGPLVQFAKAYLGAFARTEDGRDAAARVGLVANPDLAAAALDGFAAAMQRKDIPTPREIGAATVDGGHDALAYVVLAGVDRVADSGGGVQAVPPRALAAALCYHYAHIVSDDAPWIEAALRERADTAGPALRDFWVAMAARGARFLPGFNQFDDNTPEHLAIMQHVLVPLLQAWRRCSDRVLRELLHASLRHADADRLRSAARAVLSHPRGLSKTAVVYWHATLLLLDPDESVNALTALIGRSKEKVLRLLDFVVPPMESGPGRSYTLPPAVLAELLRLIGPIFPPQGDLDGRQDAIEQKVLWLFDRLGDDASDDARAAVVRLRRVRVMRRCTDVLDRVERAQASRRA